MKTILTTIAILLFSKIAISQTDQLGFEKHATYNITVDVGGKTYALTHVVPADREKNLIGTNPSKESVELKLLIKGEKSQLWLLKAEFEKEPGYKIFSRISAPEDNPHSPLLIYKVNGQFASDDESKFYNEFNKISVGLNQSETDRTWSLEKLASKKFKIHSYLGLKKNQRPKGDSYGFAEERVLQAYKAKDGSIKLRLKVPSSDATQEWTFTKVGSL